MVSDTSKMADYPLGSLESRAAARAALDAQQVAQRGVFAGISVQFVGRQLDDSAVCTCPPVPRGQIAFCHCLTMEGEIRA